MGRAVMISTLVCGVLTILLYFSTPLLYIAPLPLRASLLFPAVVQTASAARQPYDVRKIIEAFRHDRDNLIILCAHRGLRWNGTAENSRDAYFRAAEAGIECIETDVHISLDGHLPMIHDDGLGRTTDVGERAGKAAYNPFTGKGYNPPARTRNFTNDIEKLHLRDEGGRVRGETVPTLPQMVEMIYESAIHVVLQLDFKEKEAIEPAYWALKDLTNADAVPANEWCIYKLQSDWYKTPTEFESLPWVQDAFQNGIQLAYIPVYNPKDVGFWDQLAGLEGFMRTNYTIAAEIELFSVPGPLSDLLKHVQSKGTPGAAFNSTGVLQVSTTVTTSTALPADNSVDSFPGGDFVNPITSPLTFWDTANYTLPASARVNNSAFVYEESRRPVLLDWLTANYSKDGHDYRQDFNWLVERGFNFVITDTADEWHERLSAQGKRNVRYFLRDGEEDVLGGKGEGWFI